MFLCWNFDPYCSELADDGVCVKWGMRVVRPLELGVLKGLINHFWRSPAIFWLFSLARACTIVFLSALRSSAEPMPILVL